MNKRASIFLKGFNPDPSIIFDGSYYYVVTSTFEYFPGVPLYRSKDLKSWEYVRSILDREDNLDLRGAENSKGGVYAATIRYHKGMYYMITTNKNIGWNYLVSSPSLTSPWSKPVLIRKNGIDPSLFFDDDGTAFYVSNGVVNGVRGILGAKINVENGVFEEEERILFEGISKVATEAPHIYKRNGWYYLFFAEGGTGLGHNEKVVRSRSLCGPWEYMGRPLISNRDYKGYILQATGHMDIVEGPNGEWHAVFLGIRVPQKAGLHQLGRESFIMPLSWEDDWPYISEDPKVDLNPVSPTSRFIDFNKPISSYPLLKLRVPHDSYYEEQNSYSSLKLHSSSLLKEDRGTPTMLLLRQEDFNSTFKAFLDASSLQGRAGIVAWYTNDYYYRIIIEKSENGFRASSSLMVHGFEAELCSTALDKETKTIELEIITTPSRYYFQVNGIDLKDASYAGLCTEGCMYMTFTGTLLGIWVEDGECTFKDGLSLIGREE